MQAQFDRHRPDAVVIVGVIWAAGFLATMFGLVIYIAVQGYDPATSCDELWAKAFDNSQVSTNLDAWDDYELICNGGYWRP